MELTDRIQQVLKEHLPALQAQELKEFIAQAQKDAQDLKAVKVTLESKEKQVAILLEKKGEFEKADKLFNEAFLNRQATEQKERGMEVEMLRVKLDAEKRVSDSYKEFLVLISKNPRAIEIMSHFENEVQAGYTQGGQWIQPSSIQRSEQKTTEHQETKE